MAQISGTTGDLTWSFDSSTSTLTISGTGAMPSYNSTSVPWLSNLDYIRLVNIAEGVTSIGNQAFYNCSNLTSVTIPNSVTSIGHTAFFGCSSLTSVTIPESVISIDYEVFKHCSSLTSVTIGNGVRSIGIAMFQNCNSLTSVTIGNGVTSIMYDAFRGCSSLTSITIPNNVTGIGQHAFRDCSSLTSITIPNSVTLIGNHAFWGCISLTSVTIPNSVTSILMATFQNCISLTSVTIGNNVRTIGQAAFSNCISLEHIYVKRELPPSATSDIFDYVPVNSCILHVPNGSKELYEQATAWKNFLNIQEEALIVVTPQATSVNITWDVVAGADTYTLVIYGDEAKTQEVYSVNLDVNGNVQQSRMAAVELSHTVNDLLPQTVYYYSITAYDIEEEVLTVSVGDFSTDAEPLSVDKLLSAGISVYVQGNNIVIAGVEQPQVTVFDISGKTIATGRMNIVTVKQAGVYIVSVNGETRKVIL